MAFIRLKTINGRDYYYLVESSRRGSRVTQRVLQYLGRCAPTFNRRTLAPSTARKPAARTK